jgi:DNA-directed RNA polymerase subunit K/omega
VAAVHVVASRAGNERHAGVTRRASACSPAFLSPSATRPQPSPKPVCEGFIHSTVYSCCQKGTIVVHRPVGLNAFEFAVLAGLRAAQLARGCTPRVLGASKLAVIAQLEVAEGKIVRDLNVVDRAS